MDFWVLLIAIPFLLIVVLSKGFLLALRPSSCKPSRPVTPAERDYSTEALKNMTRARIDKEAVEEVIRSGTKTSRHQGSKFRHTDAYGLTIVVLTDPQGNVESVGV